MPTCYPEVHMKKIITIGREFGSGGREFGRRLAEALEIEYYDKEILTAIANHTSLSEEYVQQVVEHRQHCLYPITVGRSISYADYYLFRQTQSVYQAQCEIIKDLAEKSSCVIVGRCADYILRDYSPYRFFIYADMDSRIKRCIIRNSGDETYTEKEMKKHIQQIDRNRAKYYSFYTGRKWGEKKNYDLCLNTTGVEIREVVPAIAKIFQD